ncbi:MAG: transcriptional regulator [Candidatus Cloacimonetes bacterium]|jgi:DNA-binding transcriptional ArsR family regulator|nr:transcriptional regulator [Candidatus Cloacimonadota bacterium]
MAAKPARQPRRDDTAEDARERVEATSSPSVAAAGLDRVIHERMRLAILSALAGRDSVSFVELKALTGGTDGNVSVHARRLEEAGYVVCRKSFVGRVPRTEYRITEQGRRALNAYIDHMEALIQQVRER